MSFEIRIATPKDAEGVAQVHVQTWQETYGYAFPQDKLDAMDVTQRAEWWRKNLETSQEPPLYLAQSSTGKIVGWIIAGPSRDPDCPYLNELFALNTLAEVHGTGVGQALLDVATPENDVHLWVLEGNQRAIRFYERNGFQLDGETKTDEIFGFTARELRMVRNSNVASSA